MMEAVRAWLTSVVLVSLLLSVAQSLIPQGTVRQAASFTGGLILLLALLRPVLEADLDRLELDFSGYQAAVEERQAELAEARRRRRWRNHSGGDGSIYIGQSGGAGAGSHRPGGDPDRRGRRPGALVRGADGARSGALASCSGGRNWASRRRGRFGMSGTQKTEGVRRIWDKYKFVALVALAGIVLLLGPAGRARAESGWHPGGVSAVQAELQEEMEDILGRIQGVGEVRVLLTVDADGERQLAEDSELSYSGSTAAPEDYSRSSETVLVDGGSGEPRW